MSYLTEIEKPKSHPIVLQDIDIARSQEFWTNHISPIWYFNIEALYSGISSVWLSGIEATGINSIGSVICGTVRLNVVTSITACQETENTFYFSSAFGNCYVHCPNHDRPWIFDMKVGATTGFTDKGQPGAYYNNIYYEPRISSIPKITRSKPKQFYGITRYGGGQINFLNQDGYFDTYTTNNDIAGQESRTLLGFLGDGIDDFVLQFVGHVNDSNLDVDTFTLDIRDNTKQWTKTLPENYYNQTDYPNLKDNNIGKGKQVIYGVCLNVPCVCVNEEETPPVTYTFSICDMANHDTINAIDAVRVEGTTVAPDSTDLTTATFTITSASGDYTPGDKVTADVKGYEDSNGNLIEDALDVIKDLLFIHYGIPFTSNFYDLANWNANDDLDIGICISSDKDVNAMINEIVKSSYIDFIIQRDGKIAGKIFNKNAVVRATYVIKDVLSYIPIKENKDEVYSAIKVEYAKDWTENTYRSLIDETYADDVWDTHKIKRIKTYKTLLTDAIDAQTYATYLYEFLKAVTKIFKIEVTYRAMTLNLGDIIQVELARPTAPNIGTVKAEVISMSVDYNTGKVGLDCRIIEIIGNKVYQQGKLWYSGLYGDSLYSETKYLEV